MSLRRLLRVDTSDATGLRTLTTELIRRGYAGEMIERQDAWRHVVAELLNIAVEMKPGRLQLNVTRWASAIAYHFDPNGLLTKWAMGCADEAHDLSISVAGYDPLEERYRTREELADAWQAVAVLNEENEQLRDEIAALKAEQGVS